MAVLLHRPRDDHPMPLFFVRQLGLGFQIELPADWLPANPLSAAALADEALIWQKIGSGLRIKRCAACALPE